MTERKSAEAAAMALARTLHAGQVDKAGWPYIGHLERAVGILKSRFPDCTSAEVEAAWLHDVIKDTAGTAEALRVEGVSDEAIAIVELLTRPAGIPYLPWIDALSKAGNRSAIRVKIADNEDNRNPERVAAIADGLRMVRERYAPARAMLEAAL